MADISIDPPNSRLFILCGKTVTENELHEAFDKYGQIEDIWIVKDKATNESKGVVYIKYSKSSEAALAMEEMNGKTVGSLSKPIKVMMAHSREQGSRKDDDPERLQRLFIIVPKTATEEELHAHFKQFGAVDYISIVKNRETGESKGIAYVKYHRAYHAAKAFEECSRSYKAVFARPREPKPPTTFDGLPDRYSAPSGSFSDNLGGRWSGGGGAGQDTRLLVSAPASLREDHLHRLFDIAPGLVSIRPFMQANSQYYGVQKLLVEYSCPNAASHALDKIDGLEYPPGQRITVKPYMASPFMLGRHDDMRVGSRHGGSGGLLGAAPKSDLNGVMSGNNTTTISTSELATLTTALAKAEAIIKSAGLASGAIKAPTVPPDGDTFDPSYCSVKLPPPQPLAPPTDDATHRLFIVSQPGLPPMYALRDVFGRFGNLVEVYTLYGKNCGYVTYTTKDSADEAIKTLHLQEVCGMRMKVMVAEPPRPGGANERKRLRMDVEDSN